MNDKQIFAAVIGGIVFTAIGGLFLIALIQLLLRLGGGHIDGGDGWGLFMDIAHDYVWICWCCCVSQMGSQTL